ncbi:hypothetical protein CRYUN_Cryun04dG0110300 [Craigia yunnanensis]
MNIRLSFALLIIFLTLSAESSSSSYGSMHWSRTTFSSTVRDGSLSARQTCHGLFGECIGNEEETVMESDISRRALAGRKSRPGIQQKLEVVVTEDDNLRRDANASWKRESDGEENVVSTRDWIKIQYGRLAQLKGMRVVEFSRWVLSATPSERESVLQDYKRRKKETSNG